MLTLQVIVKRQARVLDPVRRTLLRSYATTGSDQGQNKNPIILVHGVLGWGRDELLGLKYFGGLNGDFQKRLRQKNYDVRTATVGPVSSNWDRACELYAQIKGGTVDYGEAHSKLHGHSRYGKTFPGLFTDWGTRDDKGGNMRKVHLIGHSMGGQTIRMLAQLLAHGTDGAPTDEKHTKNASPLFKGGKGDWIHSITSISTPHLGTILADDVGSSPMDVFLKTTLASFAGFLATTGADSQYDFKLDQWGINAKGPNESFLQYINRITSSKVLKPGFKDFSIYDLTMKGAKELNQWVKTQPNIYHFSFSTADTHKKIIFQVPDRKMFLPLQPSALWIGGLPTQLHGLSEKWQENDGAVPKKSQKGPENAIINTSGAPEPGKWLYMPHIKNTDHMAVTGWVPLKDPIGIYENHAKLLKNLPIVKESTVATKFVSLEPHEHIQDIKSSIEAWNANMLKENTPEELKKFSETQVSEVAKAACRNLATSH